MLHHVRTQRFTHFQIILTQSIDHEVQESNVDVINKEIRQQEGDGARHF